MGMTKRLREKGTMLGAIEIGRNGEPVELYDPNATDLVSAVSVEEIVSHEVAEDVPTVVLLDCGCKTSIIRNVTSELAGMVYNIANSDGLVQLVRDFHESPTVNVNK